MIQKSLFITFEGPDGAGKDTQIEKIKKYFKKNNYSFSVFKDPSPTVAFEIRQILLNKKLHNTTRLFLYLAARNELLKNQIEPALKNNKIVICNRFSLTTYTYQGLYFNKQDIDIINKITKIDIQPDLQIVYLSKKSFRNPIDNNVMDDFCNQHRKNIINKYIEFEKYKEFNIKIIWVDNKSINEVYKETLSIINSKLNG